MIASGDGALWVILVGILSTTQNHLAKALERQGIEVFDQIRAWLLKTGGVAAGGVRKPLIYTVGLILNHTTFLYHLLVVPLGGTTALYTSMYGIGLVALLVYSTRVMHEKITSLELAGAGAILVGTLIIGLEGIWRPPLDMAQMDVRSTLLALGMLLGGSLGWMAVGLRNASPKVIGLAFGLSAGICGALDPFLKGVGQAAGGGAKLAPGTGIGWVLFVVSFVIGEAAVVITQWGFIRRARANILVPAFNCSYIATPVALQAFLLPGYDLYVSSWTGLGLIMGGIILMRAFKRQNGEQA